MEWLHAISPTHTRAKKECPLTLFVINNRFITRRVYAVDTQKTSLSLDTDQSLPMFLEPLWSCGKPE
jgi:hypothetical protein